MHYNTNEWIYIYLLLETWKNYMENKTGPPIDVSTNTARKIYHEIKRLLNTSTTCLVYKEICITKTRS